MRHPRGCRSRALSAPATRWSPGSSTQACKTSVSRNVRALPPPSRSAPSAKSDHDCRPVPTSSRRSPTKSRRDALRLEQIWPWGARTWQPSPHAIRVRAVLQAPPWFACLGPQILSFTLVDAVIAAASITLQATESLHRRNDSCRNQRASCGVRRGKLVAGGLGATGEAEYEWGKHWFGGGSARSRSGSPPWSWGSSSNRQGSRQIR